MAAARDIIFVFITLFIVGALLFIVNFSTKTIVNDLVNIPVINNTPAAKQAFQDTGEVVDRYDYLFFGLFIALTIGIIITGWFVGGEPLFMVIYFIVAIISVIVSMILANSWYDITTQAIFGSTLNNLPITNLIITNLPIFAAVISILGVVVMFSRPFITRKL